VQTGKTHSRYSVSRQPVRIAAADDTVEQQTVRNTQERLNPG
jgi:hypothetical protein